MAPVSQISTLIGMRSARAFSSVEMAWRTQATWRHVHFGLKSAPHRRDFRPGKEGVI